MMYVLKLIKKTLLEYIYIYQLNRLLFLNHHHLLRLQFNSGSFPFLGVDFLYINVGPGKAAGHICCLRTASTTILCKYSANILSSTAESVPTASSRRQRAAAPTQA